MRREDMTPGEAMMRAYADLLSRDGTRIVYVGKDEFAQHAGGQPVATARQIVGRQAGERGGTVAR